MKIFTKNFLYFILAACVIISICRVALSYALNAHNLSAVIMVSILWGLTMFSAGWYFGKRDGNELPLYQSGYRFHLFTYLLFGSISYAWFVFGNKSKYENLNQLYSTLIIWGIFLLIHTTFYLLNRNKSIKGLEKSEIFE